MEHIHIHKREEKCTGSQRGGGKCSGSVFQRPSLSQSTAEKSISSVFRQTQDESRQEKVVVLLFVFLGGGFCFETPNALLKNGTIQGLCITLIKMLKHTIIRYNIVFQ